MIGSVFTSGPESIILRMLLLRPLRPHISYAKSGFSSLGLGSTYLGKAFQLIPMHFELPPTLRNSDLNTAYLLSGENGVTQISEIAWPLITNHVGKLAAT